MFKPVTGGICAAQGFKAGGVHSGIRKNTSKKDLAMILCETGCNTAAVYTSNKVKGAPLILTKKHIGLNNKIHGLLCNSGNANTCNPNGMEIAQGCCKLAAEATGFKPEEFVIASTGVIGQPMSLVPFENGIPPLVQSLSADGSTSAAQAIMTTDTVEKEFAVEFSAGGKTCRLGAIGKGSGMINPNMATMLVFITTDAAVSQNALHQILSAEVKNSLNQISIDGDTSTNDMTILMANGLAGNEEITGENSPGYAEFCQALNSVCTMMARALAADGEGATKLLECKVEGAPTHSLANAIAKSVISSDLFKSAMFGADANWGRALCAIGYTPGDFSADKVSLIIQSPAGSVHVCENSAYKQYSEETAAKVLAEKEISILINLNDGGESGIAWGCDLTYDYVKINGDYRT